MRGSPRELVPNLSSDWYWEQDAELRFTRVDVRSGDAHERTLADRLLGKRRWETGIEIEGGWDEHRAVLEARQPFRDVLMWRELEDGSRRYMLVSGDPVFDARGHFAGYRGIGRDITPQKRVERLLRLEHRIMRRLSESVAPRPALANALRVLCETERWDCAEIWKLDERAGVLRRYAHWFDPADEGARRFIEGSSALSFAPGEGLVGATWRSGEPLSVADSRADPRAARGPLAEGTGLDAAVLFPIWIGGRVNAVLAVTSRRMRALHKRVHQALHVIAGMIGNYLERTAAEQAVRESEARFRSLTNLSSDWYWEQDESYRFTRLEGRYVTGGDASLRSSLMGRQRWESGLEVEGGWEAHRAALGARRSFHELLMWRERPDGSVRYISVSGEPVFDEDGRFTGYRGVGRDVTAHKRSEQLLKLEHQVARLLAAAEDSATGVREVMRAICEAEKWACGIHFPVADNGRLEFADAWCDGAPASLDLVERSRSLAFAPGEGLAGRVLESGEPVWTTDAGVDARVREKGLVAATGTRGTFVLAALSEGRTVGVLLFSSPKLRQPDERLLQAARVIGSQVGQFLQRKRTEERISSLAYSDPLTGLANRTSLGPSLEQAVLRARRRHSKLAVVFIDLDGFKSINDLHGHDAGDAFLVEMARRLRKHLRASDLVARLGGDEFLVVLEEVTDATQVDVVARKLLAELARPHAVPVGELQVTASIGISVLPDDASDAGALMKHADTAMYAAKEAGKNTLRFYAATAANDPAREASASGLD